MANSSSALFYHEITPLNREIHRGFRLEIGAKRFGFARGSAVIPALLDEFMAASTQLPIMFMVGTPVFTPIFVVGLRTGTNALVAQDGGWSADYLPAYLRRYPFIIGDVKGGEPIICVDQTSSNLRAETGPALFDDDRKESPALLERIRFASDYYSAAQKNAAFIAMLVELELLQTVAIDATFAAGDAVSLQGYMTVDVKRLEALPDEGFARLRKGGYLGPIYAHLVSMNCIDRIRRAS